MYITETKIRVRYAETDRMGYVYYGNYAQYFEVGRVEALRQLGMTYKEMEDDGIMLPVLEYFVKYFKPAFYDEELTIKTIIKEMPKARLHFEYETYNHKGDLINKGNTTLVFINIQTGKPCVAPPEFIEKLKPFISG